MEQNPLVEIGLPVALAIIMVGIGLSLMVRDFEREARQPKGLVVGSIGQLIGMPAIGFLLVALLDLPVAIAVGIVVAAACPGGTTSNLISYLARANVALSIVLTVVASVVTIVSLPLFVDLALRWQGASAEIQVPLLRTVATLFGVVLIPTMIGMLVRVRAPHRAAKLERSVSVFGAVVLIALIIGIAISLRDELVELLTTAGPAAILLNLGGIALGFALGAVARLPLADRFTFAVELGIKNSTLGILLGVTVMGSAEIAAPSAVYGVLMYVSGVVLVVVGRRVLGQPAPVADPTR